MKGNRKFLSQKGENTEKTASMATISQGVPLLVSPIILRSLGLGQIDLCYFDFRGTITVVESKASGRISKKQRRRLLKSCEFLSAIFKRPSQLQYFFPSTPSSN